MLLLLYPAWSDATPAPPPDTARPALLTRRLPRGRKDDFEEQRKRHLDGLKLTRDDISPQPKALPKLDPAPAAQPPRFGKVVAQLAQLAAAALAAPAKTPAVAAEAVQTAEDDTALCLLLLL